MELLKSKLSTNACCLIFLTLLVCTLFSSYTIASTIKSYYDTQTAEYELDYIYGISQLINAPLYLVLFTLVSVQGNTTILLNQQDAIDIYLNNFISANAFTQILKYSQDPILSNTKKNFNLLDSSSFCNEYLLMIPIIEGEYPAYSYTYLNAITQSICSNFQNNILLSGITQAVFMIFQEVQKVQSQRKSGVNKINVDQVVNCLNMIHLFIAPAYEGLMLSYMNDIDNNYQQEDFFIIGFYVCYVIAAILVHYLYWTCFLQGVEQEFIKSRGMLKIMPVELLSKLKKMKREEGKEANQQVLQFFANMQKT